MPHAPSPELLRALAEMAREANTPPEAATELGARKLMHAAVARQAATTAQPASFREQAAGLLGRHVRFTGAVVTAAAAATMVVLGWSAPAGSPLHGVRLVRESVALHLPGADDATLVLGYAEERMSDAASGRDPQASLAEASQLLKSCRGYLPSDHSDPVWQRWTRDEVEVARLEAQLIPSPGSSPNGSGPAVGEDEAPGQPHSSGVGGTTSEERSGSASSAASPGEDGEGPPPSRTSGRSSSATSTESEGSGDGGFGTAPAATTTQTSTQSQSATSSSSTSDQGGSGSESGGAVATADP